MKEENKRCWSCGRFQRYYTKGYCNLQKEDVGFCPVKSKVVCENDCCEFWNYRPRIRNMRKLMAISSIADMHSKLEVIEQILTEEREAEKAKNEK